MFDHEKLDAYRLALTFAAQVSAILDALPRAGRPDAVKHLEEASTSIVLNIAEGNGKRSLADRMRFLDVARGSALECAGCLDVLVIRRKLEAEVANSGKATLVRIVSTITKLVERLSEMSSTSPRTSTSRRTSTSQ